MKLLTKEVESKIPALYPEQETDDPMVVAKFFNPTGSWTWYVTNGGWVCPEHNNYDCAECAKPWSEYMFFGLVDGDFPEMGYFSLSELSSYRGPFGLGIERDIYWTPVPLSVVQNKIGARC